MKKEEILKIIQENSKIIANNLGIPLKKLGTIVLNEEEKEQFEKECQEIIEEIKNSLGPISHEELEKWAEYNPPPRTDEELSKLYYQKKQEGK